MQEERYESSVQGEVRSTEELFGDFYEMLTGQELDEVQKKIVKDAANAAGGQE